MSGDFLQRLYDDGRKVDQTWSGFQKLGTGPLVDLVDGVGQKFGIMPTGLNEARKQLELATERLWEPLRPYAAECFDMAQSLCGSPIERRILPWLICNNFRYLARIMPQDKLDNLSKTQVALVPQYVISGFRLDFGLVRLFDCGLRVIGIECDGKEFHQDESRDLRRDQTILESVFIIGLCRISGKFIRRSPEKAAARAIRYADRCWNLVGK